MEAPIDLLDRLERELKALQAKTYRARSPQELRTLLQTLCAPWAPHQIALEDRPLLRLLEREGTVTGAGKGSGCLDLREEKKRQRETDWQAVQEVVLGISGVDYALADTGTLVFFSASSHGRWTSLASRIHVALLPTDRILPSLDELFSLLDSDDAWLSRGSAVTLITGPSRTADIELNLVLGAHGPREVHLISLLFPLPDPAA